MHKGAEPPLTTREGHGDSTHGERLQPANTSYLRVHADLNLRHTTATPPLPLHLRKGKTPFRLLLVVLSRCLYVSLPSTANSEAGVAGEAHVAACSDSVIIAAESIIRHAAIVAAVVRSAAAVLMVILTAVAVADT